MVVRRLIPVLALALLLAATACKPTLPKYNYAAEPDPRNSEWILGVGDQISINVWENAALNTEATIRPDGSIMTNDGITLPSDPSHYIAIQTVESYSISQTEAAPLVRLFRIDPTTGLVTVIKPGVTP